MKFRVTRHHSCGKAKLVKDPLYPGVLFPDATLLHVFIETQADDSSIPDAGGLCVSFKNNEWHVSPLSNDPRKIVVDE